MKIDRIVTNLFRMKVHARSWKSHRKVLTSRQGKGERNSHWRSRSLVFCRRRKEPNLERFLKLQWRDSRGFACTLWHQWPVTWPQLTSPGSTALCVVDLNSFPCPSAMQTFRYCLTSSRLAATSYSWLWWVWVWAESHRAMVCSVWLTTSFIHWLISPGASLANKQPRF